MHEGHRVVKKLPRKNNQSNECVGCGKVDPFAYTGTLIKSTGWGSFEKIEPGTVKVSGVIECMNQSYPVVIKDPDEHLTKRYPFYNKVRGKICTECAADYRTVKGPDGTFIPVVKLDMEKGQLRIPTVERVMESNSGSSSSTPPPEVKTGSSQIDSAHWLNVGRKKHA